MAAVASRQVARTWRVAQGGARREVAEIDGMTDGRVSIKVAADRLGVSQDAVRRRLKNGDLVGEKETTPQGFVWRVELPADTPEVEPRADDVVPAPEITTPDPSPATTGDQREDAPTASVEPPGATQGVESPHPSSWWARTWRWMRGG